MKQALGAVGTRALLENLKTLLDKKADLTDNKLPRAQMPDVQWDDVKGRPGDVTIVPSMSIDLPADLTNVPSLSLPALGITAYYISDMIIPIEYQDYFSEIGDIYLVDGGTVVQQMSVQQGSEFKVADYGDAWAFVWMMCVLEDGWQFEPAPGFSVTFEHAGVYFLDMPVDEGINVIAKNFSVNGGKFQKKISYYDLDNAPVGKVRTSQAYTIEMPDDLSELTHVTSTIDTVEYTMYRVHDLLNHDELEGVDIVWKALYAGEFVDLERVERISTLSYGSDEMVAYVSGKFYNVLMDGAVADGITFPTAGLYLATYEDTIEYEGDNYECIVCAAVLDRHDQFENKTLDAQYLPTIPLSKIPAMDSDHVANIKFEDLSPVDAPCYSMLIPESIMITPSENLYNTVTLDANGVAGLVTGYPNYSMKFKSTDITVPYDALDIESFEITYMQDGTELTAGGLNITTIYKRGFWHFYSETLGTILACVRDHSFECSIDHIEHDSGYDATTSLGGEGSVFLVDTYLDDNNYISVQSVSTHTGRFLQRLAYPYTPNIDFTTRVFNHPFVNQSVLQYVHFANEYTSTRDTSQTRHTTWYNVTWTPYSAVELSGAHVHAVRTLGNTATTFDVALTSSHMQAIDNDDNVLGIWLDDDDVGITLPDIVAVTGANTAFGLQSPGLDVGLWVADFAITNFCIQKFTGQSKYCLNEDNIGSISWDKLIGTPFGVRTWSSLRNQDTQNATIDSASFVEATIDGDTYLYYPIDTAWTENELFEADVSYGYMIPNPVVHQADCVVDTSNGNHIVSWYSGDNTAPSLVSVIAGTATVGGQTLSTGLWAVMQTVAGSRWSINKQVPDYTRMPVEYLPDSVKLPTMTSSDNGKVLRVVNGQWAATNPVFEVVLEFNGGVITGDKRYLDVAEAFFAGRNVRMNMYDNGHIVSSTSVVDVSLEDDNGQTVYNVTVYSSGQALVLSGAPSAYISANLGA